MSNRWSCLDARLLEAHARGRAEDLVQLYARAADEAEDDKARAFYLTHAYVYALDSGHGDADTLREALIAMGCERP